MRANERRKWFPVADTEQIPGNTESSSVVEDGQVQRSDDPTGSEATDTGGASDEVGAESMLATPMFDRSRALLRLPTNLVTDTLDLAHVQSMPAVAGGVPEPQLPEAIEKLEAAGIMTGGVIDPVAQQLLEVVNQASLIVTIRLTYGEDASTSTIWATPRMAVMSSTLGEGHVDYQPVSVSQLPQTLAQLIVLQSPRFVGDVLLELDASLLEQVTETREDVEAAAQLLTDAGLDSDQAILLVDLQRSDTRRWRITSQWSTEDGPLEAEMVGVDGGASGQWLITAEQPPDAEQTRVLYTPQGHGEVMSGFRGVLPKNWLGTPLNPPRILADAE
jgi:hypothetical protein